MENFILDKETYFDKPILIEIREDGTLNLDPRLPPVARIDLISKKLESPPRFGDLEDLVERSEARARYQCLQASKIFYFLKEEIDLEKLNHLKGDYWRELKKSWASLGAEVQEVFDACSRRAALQEVASQQWGKYKLSLEELGELDFVAARRREISVRRANWETSPSFIEADPVTRAVKASEFDKELAQSTTPLWTVLHLGTNYLGTFERYKIEKHVKVSKFSSKQRREYIEERLLELRLFYLELLRKEGKDFVLPTPKS